ncbi:hypothetical protein [Eggerthella sp. YY7918]|uniref:hypothetical protein n=1 Tax=Eggerthella sp. (strain YY7918) TaxID=502558 RepID=UPI00021714BB|nr:hypothetical protein [Eggerthella sp. YY7918]BAK44329.1 hypothetical protein EGYY_11620 [Eggerthella sp. YY7918]
MAVDETKFSHITVSDDEDDDIVIQAGSRVSEPLPDEVEVVSVSAQDAVSSQVEDQKVVNERPSKESSRTKEYRETTAEDLEVGPMSLTQKIVIAVAVLAIIAFAVYYLVLR